MSVQQLQKRLNLSEKSWKLLHCAQTHSSAAITRFSNPFSQLQRLLKPSNRWLAQQSHFWRNHSSFCTSSSLMLFFSIKIWSSSVKTL